MSEEKNKSEATAAAPRSVVEFASSSPAPKRVREDNSHVPLIIPVSVPVKKLDAQDITREKGEDGKQQRFLVNDHGIADSKPSVIVTRRRSNRNLNMDSSAQVDLGARDVNLPAYISLYVNSQPSQGNSLLVLGNRMSALTVEPLTKEAVH